MSFKGMKKGGKTATTLGLLAGTLFLIVAIRSYFRENITTTVISSIAGLTILYVSYFHNKKK